MNQEAFDELRARLSVNGRGPEYPRPVLDIDYGWVPLVNAMLDELEFADPDHLIDSITCRHGELRVTGHYNSAAQEVIYAFEAESLATCEVTGLHDALWYLDTGMFRTLSPRYVATLPVERLRQIEASHTEPGITVFPSSWVIS